MSGSRSSSSRVRPAPRPKQTACNQCAVRKRRCDGNGADPCTLCFRAGRDCTYLKGVTSSRSSRSVHATGSSSAAFPVDDPLSESETVAANSSYDPVASQKWQAAKHDTAPAARQLRLSAAAGNCPTDLTLLTQPVVGPATK